jgi:protease I
MNGDRPLTGKKIAILVESLYIPEEIKAYTEEFPQLGATVDLMSRLWDQPELKIVSDPNGLDEHGTPNQAETMIVDSDFDDVRLEDYAAVIMSANYTSVRLRFYQPPQQPADAPAVVFFARAMQNPRIVKGALCHGLWILTPRPDLLHGRHVTCHEVVRADVLNAGAIYTSSSDNVVVDGDLVTGYSKNEVHVFIKAIARTITELQLVRSSGDS